MLSSFINRRKVKKISLFDAALRRAPSPPSLEIQSDQEGPRSKQWTLSKLPAPTVTSLRASVLHRRQSSPKVHLDFTPSGSNDWFPQEILAPHDDDFHLPVQPVPESSVSSVYDDVVVIGPEHPPLKRRDSPALPPLPVEDDPSPNESGHDATTPPLSRKPAPAPIKIPNHPSKVQIQRSASIKHSSLGESSALFPTISNEPPDTLRPGTIHSSSAVSLIEDSSAISGTTLARALIANSFILSDNPGRSRYRSGATVARQDSATLPGPSENGLLVSPYWRDRRISCGEIVHSPDSGIDSRIPPVPPIPRSLSSAMSHTRHLSTEESRKPPSRSQSLRTRRLSNRRSKKPEPALSSASVATSPSDNSPPPTQISVSGDNPRPPLLRSQSNRSTLHDNSPNRPLNHPSSPPRDSSPNLNATASGPAPVSVRRSQLPSSLNLSSPSTVTDGEDSSRLRPTPSDNQDEPQRTGVSSNTTRTERTLSSAISGEDITKVLTAYQFVSPLKSSFPIHMHGSPDPSSTPPPSLWSGGSKSGRTDTSNSMSFPQTPDSATKRSQNGLSVFDMGRVFPDPAGPGQRQSGPSRPGLLPIGNGRPRSFQVPSSPLSRKSNESRRSTDDTSSVASNIHSSGISSPDILDFMFIPSGPSLSSRPHPIKVIRDSLDSSEGILDRSPTTTEALRQTFPETPQAFSPLFSANLGTPVVPPLLSSMGTPGTPLSATSTKGKFRKGISNPLVKRSASLYTWKMSSSSNRTRMSPIPSAPGTPESPEVRKVNDAPNDSGFEAQQSRAAANLLTPPLSAPGKNSSPVPPSPRRSSDPTGHVSRDLNSFPGGVGPPEVSHSTSVIEPEPEISGDTPSQRSTPGLPGKSPSSSVHGLGAAEDAERLPTPDHQGKDGDDASVSSTPRLSPRGSPRSNDRMQRSGPRRRPRPLDLPVVKSDDEPITKQSDGSSEIHQGHERAGPSSQANATPKTGTIPAVSADTSTPAILSSAVSVRSLNTPEQLSPRVAVLPSPDPSSSHPSPNSSLHTTPNISVTSSPAPSSQRSPAPSSSSLSYVPSSSPSQVHSTSSALPSSTLVSPIQHDRSNSLDVPSFASFLRQSYADPVAVHPPPPYQTAILSKAVPLNVETEPPAGPGSSLPSYIHAQLNQQSGKVRPELLVQIPQAHGQRSTVNVTSISEGVGRERSDSTSDTRIPRSRPLGPRNPSGSQGPNKASSLGVNRSRQASVSSVLRPGFGLGVPPTSRKLSTVNSRGRSGPRFPTVPVKWRGYTLDVAKWTFTSQQLQEIASRAIEASAESYYVRLLKLETLDTELPEELHRLELLTTDLKCRLRATAVARRELLDALTAHTSGTGTLDRSDLEKVVEELGEVTQLAEELNDGLYTVTDQIAQLKRLRDVHSSSALAVSLRKLNTSFLRQATDNQLLRERVAALEAERDIAWTQAECVAQEFDDLSIKLEQGAASTPSSTNNSRRTSRVSAVRRSSVRISKSGLRQSAVGKASPGTSKRSSNVGPTKQPSEDIPPVPPLPDAQDLGNAASRRRPPFIQTLNLPDQDTPVGLYSDMTPNTENRALAQAQRELCEMLGISLVDSNTPKSRPRTVSGFSRHGIPELVRSNSDVKPLTPKRHTQPHWDYLPPPYDRELTLASLTLRG